MAPPPARSPAGPASPIARSPRDADVEASLPYSQQRQQRGRGRTPPRRGWWWQRLFRVTTRLFKPPRQQQRRTGGNNAGQRNQRQRQRQQRRNDGRVNPCDLLSEQCQHRRFFVQYTRQHVQEEAQPVAAAGGGSPERLSPTVRFLVEVSGSTGELLTSNFGEGETVSAARNAAAAVALAALGAQGEVFEGREEKASAWLGDAVLSTLVGVMGLQAGLDASSMHEVSKLLFSNDALSAVSPQKLVSSYATATAMEAEVGRAANLKALAPLLRSAVHRASPELMGKIEAAIAAKEEAGRRRRETAAAAEVEEVGKLCFLGAADEEEEDFRIVL